MSSTSTTCQASSQPSNKNLKILAHQHCINVNFLKLVTLYAKNEYFRNLHALTCLVYVLQAEQNILYVKDSQ